MTPIQIRFCSENLRQQPDAVKATGLADSAGIGDLHHLPISGHRRPDRQPLTGSGILGALNSIALGHFRAESDYNVATLNLNCRDPVHTARIQRIGARAELLQVRRPVAVRIIIRAV